jgi:hypothetical protein
MEGDGMTRASVQLALKNTIEEVDGQFRCRICPRLFTTKKAVPVHELTHRRAVGLAPPAHTGGKMPVYIVCEYQGCTDRMIRTSLPPHLMSKKHGLDRAAASFYARKRSEAERGRVENPMNLAPVKLSDEEADAFFEAIKKSPMTGLDAVEAVTGILGAARSDGLLPTRLLPAVHDLIGHTETVLEELRRLSE